MSDGPSSPLAGGAGSSDNPPRRIRLGIVYGGRSDEHEVSVMSARSVIKAIDRTKFDVVPIGITRAGHWLLDVDPLFLEDNRVSDQAHNAIELMASASPTGLVAVNQPPNPNGRPVVDVIFPLLHGPFGEDGTLQGVLELGGVPYVGSGVGASAVGMDKSFMKSMFGSVGLPTPRWLSFSAHEWKTTRERVMTRLASDLEFPVFIKPCRLGSSVGISKASTPEELIAGIESAVAFDSKIIVEQGIDGREVECGVLGNHEPMVSAFGEIVAKHEFYDYEAKYTDGLADLIIPAALTQDQVTQLSRYALKAFEAIDARGLARIDFFIERPTGRILVNEINTMPGMTQTSMFPKLWEASGLRYASLIERLVELAFEQFGERR